MDMAAKTYAFAKFTKNSVTGAYVASARDLHFLPCKMCKLDHVPYLKAGTYKNENRNVELVLVEEGDGTWIFSYKYAAKFGIEYFIILND
jgi:hypothetical protein